MGSDGGQFSDFHPAAQWKIQGQIVVSFCGISRSMFRKKVAWCIKIPRVRFVDAY